MMTMTFNPRVGPRYIVDRMGTPVRPHRVFDTHKREAIICTADPVIAERMAEEYEKQWKRSTWMRRNWKRAGRWVRAIAGRFQRRPQLPPSAPTEREKKVQFIEDLCAKHRVPVKQ